MVCGTFTITDVPDDQLVQTMRGFSANDPAPLSVTFRTEADGSNTVIAQFAPCAQEVSHDPINTGASGKSGSAPTMPTPSQQSGRAQSSMQLAKEAFDILTKDSLWSPAQACGVIANVEAESNFKIDAIGDGGTAFGICQWHPDRQKNFKIHFGHDMQTSSYAEQVGFVSYEMLQGTELLAGKQLKAARSPQTAGQTVSLFYERPNDPTGSVSQHRGDRAQVWLGKLMTA